VKYVSKVLVCTAQAPVSCGALGLWRLEVFTTTVLTHTCLAIASHRTNTYRNPTIHTLTIITIPPNPTHGDKRKMLASIAECSE